MKVTVLGCHGGESKKHRPTSFLVDDRLAIDAGAITRALSVREQDRVTTVLVSHSHFDHIRDLATAADNRCQTGGPGIEIVASRPTIDALRKHFFNDSLWPDFAKIPCGDGPTIRYRTLVPEKTEDVAGYQVTAVGVSHTVGAVGYVVRDAKSGLAFSGDTGPTDRFWEVLAAEKKLGAILLEVSFPDEQKALALQTKHLCPSLAREELRKLGRKHPNAQILFHHIKPVFDRSTTEELKRLDDRITAVCRLDHEYSF